MLKIIEGILNVIMMVAFLAVVVLVVMWLLDLRDMSFLDRLAFNLDYKRSGFETALYNNFKMFVYEFIDTLRRLI